MAASAAPCRRTSARSTRWSRAPRTAHLNWSPPPLGPTQRSSARSRRRWPVTASRMHRLCLRSAASWEFPNPGSAVSPSFGGHMFLEALRRRNPSFLRAAANLHAQGSVPANSYVLDTGAVTANARALSQEAARHSLTVFAMTKQAGRNPAFCAAVRAGGIDAAVAVDMADARAVRAGG